MRARETKVIHSRRVEANELCVGMYVSQLPVPWSATPFPLEGVLIRNHADIECLTKYGQHFVIDETRSLTLGMPNLLADIYQRSRLKIVRDDKKEPKPWQKFSSRRYKTCRSLSKELMSANKLFDRIGKIISCLHRDPELNRLKNTRELESISEAIVDSMMGNPDALVWLSKVRSCGSVIYDHTLRTAVWATLIGRNMGLLKSSLQAMNEAILLSGVGKICLKKKDWANCDSLEIDRNFAAWSNYAIRKLSHSKIEPKVLTILANMTERLNGTGFPHQKMKKGIPYLAQIAYLAEAFELSMNPITKKKKRSVGESLARLYWCRDSLFDGELIEELIQAVGLYPPGSLVELSSGEKGVVIEASKKRRIRPSVLLTEDGNGNKVHKTVIARLGKSEYEDVIVQKEVGSKRLTKAEYHRYNHAILRYQYGFFMAFFYRLTGVFK
ncbi:MAG: DUF3391 domain-containing protein [Kangiellaceae bacterium]|nr:DUF3391 domain-containing protein [Kangiellaceae bacterium]